MTTISIPISEDCLARLHARAKLAGIPPEEYLSRQVEEILERPDEVFHQAAAHVLQKNAELYRRLA